MNRKHKLVLQLIHDHGYLRDVAVTGLDLVKLSNRKLHMGSVYVTLSELEDVGLVAREKRADGRHWYSLSGRLLTNLEAKMMQSVIDQGGCVDSSGLGKRSLAALVNRGFLQVAAGFATATIKGRRFYEFTCADRFTPEFHPTGWAASAPVREDLKRSHYHVRDTHSGQKGLAACWVEHLHWRREGWPGWFTRDVRKSFLRVEAEYGLKRKGSGWMLLDPNESIEQHLTHFGFTEVAPCL